MAELVVKIQLNADGLLVEDLTSTRGTFWRQYGLDHLLEQLLQCCRGGRL